MKRKRIAERLRNGDTVEIPLPAPHHDHLLRVTADEVSVYCACCGSSLSRREVKRIRRALSAWLSVQP